MAYPLVWTAAMKLTAVSTTAAKGVPSQQFIAAERSPNAQQGWQAIARAATSLLLVSIAAAGVRGAGLDALQLLEAPPGLTAISLTCVDPSATGYATFQSHNQKVVQTRGEIFVAHIRTRNEAYTAQEWRLSCSTDGGKSFATVYEATHATNPPVLETDGEDIYLARPDFADGNAYLYFFCRADGFRSPRITAIPGGAAGKYAMEMDRPRGQLYFFSHNNRFFILGLDGAVRSSVELLAPGPKAVLQYPLLYLDRGGKLSAAWTTQAHGRYLYWDIHFLSSPDGGEAWRKMAGTPVALPVVADESGPSDRITLDDEFEAHTWLSSFFVRGGKAHFLYLAQTQPPRQHCVRYDLAAGRRERDRSPRFGVERISLRSLDGFFAVRPDVPGSTIYCIARDADESRIACLVSDDDGESWYDYARSEPVQNPYSIGGCREIGPDGAILGSFTEQTAPTTDPGGGSKVQFFRLQGGIASARGKLQAVQKVEKADGGRFIVGFSEVRGQPSQVRFAEIDGPWSPWQAYRDKAEVPGPQPARFQLRSALGVVSKDAIVEVLGDL